MKEIWRKLCSTHSNNHQDIDQSWELIIQHHSEPHRFYHNLNHLNYMLKLIEKHKTKIQDPNLMRLSVFMHDIIYDVTIQNNEEKSAEKAEGILNKLNLPQNNITYIKEQILATKKHEFNQDPDINILLDFDLGILSENEKTYQVYSNNIRKEYGIYSNSQYNQGRTLVLKSFLDKRAIYLSDIFDKSREQKARLNLRNELETIQNHE